MTQERVQPDTPQNHIIAQTQETIPSDQNISFLGIPGHASIPGSERRRACKRVMDEWANHKKISGSRLQSHLQQYIKPQRQRTWDELGRELQMHHIKPELCPWSGHRPAKFETKRSYARQT